MNEQKISVGKNAKHNWQLLENASPNDLFFHLSKFPSCYVIYENKNDEIIDLDTIKNIANICKNNTKYKHLNDIKIDYTTCSNVKKGDKIGEIYYVSNKKVKQIKL